MAAKKRVARSSEPHTPGEFQAVLNMVNARIAGDPDTSEEWETIRAALQGAMLYAQRTAKHLRGMERARAAIAKERAKKPNE